jgi:hypothetical protein
MLGAAMAHLHVPKPLHGWREFVGEVGIIVLGVLIALATQQLVQRFHDREETFVSKMRERRKDPYTRAWGCLGVGMVLTGAPLFHLYYLGVGASASVEIQEMIVSGALIAGGLVILLAVLRRLGS